MNDQPDNPDLDPLTRYKATHPEGISLINPINQAFADSIIRQIQDAKTPEEIKKWLQLKESIEMQTVQDQQYLDEERRMLWEHQLKLFDEIRLTVFSGLLLSLGITMIFLKMPQPGLVLVIISSLRILKYSLSELSKLFGKFYQNIGVLIYLLSLISLFFYVLIWIDISEGTQQSLIILITVIVLFSLSVVKYTLAESKPNSTIDKEK